jgi:hypothetical protein
MAGRQASRRPLRHLRLRRSAGGLWIEFDAAQAIPSFLPSRRTDALARVRGSLRRLGAVPILISGHRLSARLPDPHPPPGLSDLDRRIGALASAPLTPAAVKQILGITGQERSRWTKDGRLARASSGVFRAGQHRVSFSRHPVDAIASLVNAPDTIEAWRTEDAQTRKLRGFSRPLHSGR